MLQPRQGQGLGDPQQLQRFTMPSTFWQFGGGIISDDSKKSLLDSDATIAATQYWYT